MLKLIFGSDNEDPSHGFKPISDPKTSKPVTDATGKVVALTPAIFDSLFTGKNN